MILVPQYKDQIELVGSVSFVLTDTTTNKIRQEIYAPNLVVTTGKIFIAGRMVGTPAVMTHMGIGLSSTQEVVADTGLGTELSTAPATYTSYSRASLSTSSSASNVVTYVATFAANNPSAPVGGAVLREAGIFNLASAGTMLCRTTFPTVTKLPADALTITWTITIQ